MLMWLSCFALLLWDGSCNLSSFRCPLTSTGSEWTKKKQWENAEDNTQLERGSTSQFRKLDVQKEKLGLLNLD